MINKTFTTKGGSVIWLHSFDELVNLDGWTDYGTTFANHLTYAEAHEIADWIRENVPVPEPEKKPTAWDHWRDLPEGATFRVDHPEDTAYTKMGDLIRWDGQSVSGGTMKRAWESLPYDFIREYTPTIKEQIAELPNGARFHFSDDPETIRVKVSETHHYSPTLDGLAQHAWFYDRLTFHVVPVD